jgi:tyrosyl-tRNA synthetase
MMNFDKDALLGKWKEVSTLAQKTFNEKISAADLEKVKGNVTMMVSLVEEKLGVSKEDAQKKVEEILIKINQHELKGKAEATAGKVLETANTLFDVVKDKIKKK